ncbi:tetratricopeptide repeat-containing sensor histidine kinase [Gynurincola endophyticus]|uniref:tetratricopeptide repeat-containing sensor histidine kinase n=1 Tax=Gynurincola endophyticus TaxID=2479004 RepID=UPI000F8E4112|nr:ATP-binding protein [Gynurincola endophyticus]
MAALFPNKVVTLYSVLLCSILLLFSSTLLMSQSHNLDSMESKIGLHSTRDTIKVRLLLDYARATLNDNTTKLLPFLEEAASISREKEFRRGLQSSYLMLQIYYSDRGDVELARVYADTAYRYLKNDTNKSAITDLAWLHNNMAGDYARLADYQQAIDQLTKAATIFEQHNQEALPAIYSNIALMYGILLLPERALEYDRKAITAAEKTGNQLSIARRNLGYVARLITLKNFKEAEVILNKIEPIVMAVDNNSTYIFFYQNKGLVSQHASDYKNAIYYLKKSYSYTLKNDDKLMQVTILNPLTSVLSDAGEFSEAKIYLDTLLAKSLVHKIRSAELDAYRNYAQWYQLQKDYKMANGFLTKSIQLSDSLSSEEMREKIAAMETRFSVEGKNNEIKKLQAEKELQQLQLRQKNTLNYILMSSALALILIFLLVYRNYQNHRKLQQQRISELETEKQLAATEAVLKGEEQERARLAKDLHDGLGGMLSGIKHSFTNMKENLIMTPENAQAFERGIDLLDKSIKEMRRVAHNMMPEILIQFGLDTALKELCLEINRNGSMNATYQSVEVEGVQLEQNLSVTTYRVVQELANNALKHAHARNLLVQVHISQEDNLLLLTVEDDGKGFDVSLLEKSGGMGWRSIRNRIESVKGKIDINTGTGNGTSVLIEIPLS